MTIEAAPTASAKLRDYLELTKPRLSLLSVLTALVGYLATRPPSNPSKLFFLLIGTSLAAGGVAALNQWLESDTDAQMKRTADRLFGDQYHWSVLGAGRNQLPIATQSLALGGNVRVGLEDSLWIGPGRLAQSNAQQVRAVRQVIEGLGLEIASPDEAREMLQLKGGDQVTF